MSEQLTETTQPTVENVEVVIADDKVYLGDLEKAIEYSLTKEVSMQALLDNAKMSSLYFYLEVLVNYLELRKPIKEFLISLREWPVRLTFYYYFLAKHVEG